jgi:histidinol-phosphatase (PHP family)
MEIPRTTYHCHTTFSDGQTQLEDLVKMAAAKGMRELGVSDHLVLHPTLETIDWSMDVAEVEAYVDAFQACKETAPIPLYLGVEVDFFPEPVRKAELESVLSRYPFDYVIGSVHMIGEFSLDSYRKSWVGLSELQVNHYHIAYCEALTQMVHECPWVNIVGHLDLPKKFGVMPTCNMAPHYDAVLDAIVDAGKAIELNTAGWDKPCAEGYPGLGLLGACGERGIPLVVNDDAHAPSLLCRHYDRAAQWLGQLSYAPTWVPVED